MRFDSTWEIGVLIDTYADEIEPLKSETYDYEKERQKEEIQKLYAQSIELTAKKGYGLTMPIDMAIDWVKRGSIIDYDGMGYVLDKSGGEIESMECDVSFLQRAKENGACFVAWYNK